MLFDEVDYWGKLTPEEAEWLRTFNRAFHQGFVPKEYPAELRITISRSRDAFRRDAFLKMHRQPEEDPIHEVSSPNPEEELVAKETLARVIRHGGLGG